MTTNQKLKVNVLARFGARCFYCRKGLTQASATLDHFVPRSVKRGVPYNLRPACFKCNQAKANLTFPEFRQHVFRLCLQLFLNSFRGGLHAYTHQ
jgi:5-methylcytosine-specific restriction endonuclease McrA